LASGGAEELVAELEGLVARHPPRERLRGQLMLALYRAGRQADALAAYQDARNALLAELGLEPTRGLQELQKAILAQDPQLDARRARAITPGRRAATPVVGRDPELAVLEAGGGRAPRRRGRPLPGRRSGRRGQDEARGRAREPGEGARPRRPLGPRLGRRRRAALLALASGDPRAARERRRRSVRVLHVGHATAARDRTGATRAAR